ncbi:MAG: NUDIX domain-containing protein [Patescibacteria group bacterium]
MRELPIKIQTIVYRNDDGIKVLLIKRNLEDGGFWQTVTGTLELNESIIESRARELEEEIGIKEANFSEEIHRFSWEKKDYTVVELVYSAEVFTDKVILSSEHTEYCWLPIPEAIKKVDKQNIKNSLIKFSENFSESN